MEKQSLLEDKINKAIEYLLLYSPFYAFLALQTKFISKEKEKTISTDGLNLFYNPKELDKTDIKELASMIAHEAAHILLLHPLRLDPSMDFTTANKAADYAINALLKDSEISLPKDALYNPMYKGMSMEDIYKLIFVKPEQDGKNKQTKQSPNDGNDSNAGRSGGSDEDDAEGTGNDQNSHQSNKDKRKHHAPEEFGMIKHPDPESTVNKKELEEQLINKIAQAGMQAEMMGSMPLGLKEYITELKEPKKNWREILQHFIAEQARNDYNWNRPNKQYIQRGIYMPSLNNLEVGGIVFAIDTSGSVNTELLKEFLSELKEATSLFEKETTVIHCDTEVQLVEQVTSDNIESIVPMGRGGTRFSPVFDYVEKYLDEPKALVYFTDGKCYETLKQPSYPVIWVIYENDYFKPQFGEVIFIK